MARPAPLVAAPPPGAWAHALARRLARPVERFLEIEAASGLVLLGAALLALAWANSPWHAAYEHLWETPLGLRLGGWSFERPLHFWINDGLMAVFFFLVGLEIRRELAHGALSTLRRAALPLVAALGGMALPAALYLAINRGLPTQRGWGVPMATDIAFALGVLALLGSRVPPALRILLLALAVVDDVGAILVIALFYAGDLAWQGFLAMAAGVALIRLLQGLGVRAVAAYAVPALILWAGACGAGVHPTLAGVVVGLLTPVRAWLGTAAFAESAVPVLETLRRPVPPEPEETQALLEQLQWGMREALSPVDRLVHALHGWVAFGIMPLFALANAGVRVEGLALDAVGAHVAAGVGLGLVLGKTLGILGACALAVKLGLAVLPAGVDWKGVLVVGLAGGIGFTMALFVAGLAFTDPAHLGAAKLAILAGSGAAAVLGLAVGRVLLPGPSGAAAAAAGVGPCAAGV